MSINEQQMTVLQKLYDEAEGEEQFLLEGMDAHHHNGRGSRASRARMGSRRRRWLN